MSHCVQIIMDDPHSKREMGAGGRECVKCVGVPVCCQLSRRVAGCPRFWTKFSGSSGSGQFLAIVYTLAAICADHPNTSVLKFSHHWYWWKFTHYVHFAGFFFENMGEFSPRTCTASNMYGFYYLKCLYFTNVQHLQQTQGVKCS